MSEYIIATSSTSDLTRSWLDAHKIPCICYRYTMNDEGFEDDCSEEGRTRTFAAMRAGSLLKTSMINEFAYYDFFKELMDSGKDVIFLDMSKRMSASHENCEEAAEMIRKEYPTRRLYVMDTRCISGGLGFLVMHMVRRMEAGASFEDVLAWGEANKLRIAHRFTVDDIKYLKMGGRVSNTAALVGSLLQIKPVLYVPDEGTLEVVKKARGRRAALTEILNGIRGDFFHSDPAETELMLLHADCLSDAEYLRDELRAEYPQLGEIMISQLGVVIGAHCGPGFLAALYFTDQRRP